MPSPLERLALYFRQPSGAGADGTHEMIEVSVPASTAAVLYERVRNTLEYQEDHLIRRNAILRMLKRFASSEAVLSEAAEKLLKELVWAKYLPNRSIPVENITTVSQIIQKYEPLLHADVPNGEREFAHTFVLQMIATEIERHLKPNGAEEALAAFMYEETRARVEWDPTFSLSEEERDARLFIAIYRTLLKSDPATMRYRVFALYYPTWPTVRADDPLVANVAGNLLPILRTIDERIHDPLTERLSRLVRRLAGIYRVVGDIVEGGKVPEGEALKGAVAKAVDTRMSDFQKRLGRTVVRSILFLLITKSLFAVILEIPYDILAIGHLPIVPLIINIIFHPLFLAFIALTIHIPEDQNRKDYQAAIGALAKGEDHEYLHVRIKRIVRTRWSVFFSGMYAVLFVAVYTGIGFLLHALGFHAVSVGLFLFFFSMMAFFGIRIRLSTRDIVASEHRSGIFGTLFDIMLLPIVRAGQWLSVRVSELNIFIYFFDFIVEAPLKVAIEFIEGWLGFIREKKEEL